MLELSDSESDSSSLERKRGNDTYSKSNRKPQTHKRRQKKRIPIAVATPKIPIGFESSNNVIAGAPFYHKFKNDINNSLEKGNFQPKVNYK
jgi:hypothetical protein